MTTTIALAGKGGTGKTTVASLLIRYLVARDSASILAIDADPSANLNLALGMPLEQTIGRDDCLIVTPDAPFFAPPIGVHLPALLHLFEPVTAPLPLKTHGPAKAVGGDVDGLALGP